MNGGGGASASDLGGAAGVAGRGGHAGATGSTGGSSGAGTAGAPSTPPSCVGLDRTCGPKGNGDCCASALVPGGTFFRSYDGVTPDFESTAYPASVSDFRLDVYEITVGRFRKFVAAYSPALIAAGAGADSNDSADEGWDPSWDALLPASSGDLVESLKCNSTYQTWTDAVGSAAIESLPITCLDWYTAEAFCVWDGGRLPTEAEWNYAAAGGTEQRAYPWGNHAPDCSYANFFGAAGGTEYCVEPGVGAVNRVGSESPKGDGRFGQADLAGNAWEWVQDWYAKPYGNPCVDCADLTPTTLRGLRGGGILDGAFGQLSSFRGAGGPLDHPYLIDVGARCARAR